MEHQISNERIALAVDSIGGSMTHLQADGVEYLWQGDPAYWKGQAPHLFPIVGRLTGGRCTMEGEPCALGPHGFFRTRPMELVEGRPDRLTLSMTWDAESLAQYPRKWQVLLTYALDGATVSVTFRVKNLDEKTMYFYYGAHPGFRVPLEPGLAFTDYCLQFDPACAPAQLTLTDQYFMSGEAVPFPLEGGHLPLRHNLFDRDAVILRDTGGVVTLRAAGGTRQLTLAYPQMPYLGIWHTPKTDAPFVCLEPWCAVPARQDVVEELSEKEHITALVPGAVYENTWTITVL